MEKQGCTFARKNCLCFWVFQEKIVCFLECKCLFLHLLLLLCKYSFSRQKNGHPLSQIIQDWIIDQLVHPLWDNLNLKGSLSYYWILSFFCKAFFVPDISSRRDLGQYTSPIYSSCLTSENWPVADLGLYLVIFGYLVIACTLQTN